MAGQLIDTVDSYYQYILAGVKVINPGRQFGGIVQARDWPMKEAQLNSFYLLVVSDIPTRSPHQSFYQVLMTYSLLWVWMVQGDNIAATVQASNRGDKYVINMQMVQELLKASNPGYCTKNSYSVVPDVNNNPVLVATPYNPVDNLWWQIPSFSDKIDRTSGILFCQGKVEVSSYSPPLVGS